MFEWDNLLALAERIDLDVDDEAVQRTAINRASYAAYHAASAYVRTSGMLRGRHGHQRVWAVLRESTNADQRRIGRRGNDLRLTRIDTDCRNPFPGDVRRRAIEAVADARAIVEALRRLET